MNKSRDHMPLSIAAILIRFGLLLGLFVAVPGVAQVPAAAIPAKELAKLPYLHFSENNLGEAYLFRMHPETSIIEVGGHRYLGFTFWSTGLVDCLFINTPGDLTPSTWILLNSNGEQIHSVEPTDIPLRDCPRVAARYPQTSRVSRYRTEGKALEQRGRYHLIQRIGNAKPVPYALCFTSCSALSYEAGRSGPLIKTIAHAPLRESSDVVIENMIELRREKGMQAATEYLTREMEQRIDDCENADKLPASQQDEANDGYIGLYVNAWYEGQTGGGRLDADWASAVYGVMYDVCLRRGYYSLADVALNLTSSLALAGRFGKLSEVFDVWKEGMRLGGYNMTASSYPDLGPAFGILSGVRKRNIPHLEPYANAKPYKDLPHALTENALGCFENHAVHLWYRGQWKESLEWLVWARAWASTPDGNPESPGVGGRWHLSGTEIANIFTQMGYWEQALALHENALQQKITGGYEGKCTTRHKMAILQLKRLLGREIPSDAIEQARACILQAAGNIYEKQEFVRIYQAELGELLIHIGRISEGETLLDELAAAGSRDARIARLKHWVRSKRAKGVENELRSLLQESRETGRKMDEIVFYRLYADFLEQQNRLPEALRVRRELVRLCKAFDIFTHLPVEMARLAVLLHRMGIRDESRRLSDQALALLAKGGIPDHMAATVISLLKNIGHGDKPGKESKEHIARVEFQPLSCLIIPLKGASWTSHLTLTNPTDRNRTGRLRATGLPVGFHEVNEEDVDIEARVGAKEGNQELDVTIDPATYKIIALKPADGFSGEGKITLSWTPAKADARTTSEVRIEAPAGGTTKAIIQAGVYQMNPFYGIPIYHHYVHTDASNVSLPMRFVSSRPARVEIYTLDGTPIGIDAQGNGSLLDPGDEIFGTGDGNGNLRMPLVAGNASFLLRLYPNKELPAEGLGLRVECLDDKQWEVYAEDLLMPSPGK
jgi:tetratricopeptide (TPR) repeat protein